MGKLSSTQKRVIGIFGHHGCGKTTFMDAVLKDFSTADRIGQRYLDKESLEKEKGSTFSNHIFSVDYDDVRMFFIDTPGSSEFLGDIETALHAVDNVVIILNGGSGVEVTTERIWTVSRELKKPVTFLINGMDKEGVNFGKIIEDLKEKFENGTKVVPFHVPVGEGEDFKGLCNLITKKSYVYDENGKGQEIELPENAKAYFEKYHSELVEDIVENDEEILEKYFEGGEEAITSEEFFKCLHKAVESDVIAPVLIGSAVKNIGVDRFMYVMKSIGESADERTFKTKNGKEIVSDINGKLMGLIIKNDVDPFVGKLTFVRIISGELKPGSSFYVLQEESQEKASHIYIPRFDKNDETEDAGIGDIIVIPKLKSSKIGETICMDLECEEIEVPNYPEPMISKSIIPKSKNEIDKITSALSKLSESDPTFGWEFDSETGETVINGVGSIHLEVMTERLKKNFGVDFEVGKPKIAYRETIKVPSQAEYKHKKQTGGHGQYGHVKIKLEPITRGEGYVFEDQIVGGVIPRNFIPSVDKGIKEGIKKGVLAGYPVVDVKVVLYDGSYHDVDSSDIAFQIAARTAFKEGLKQGNPVILEPIMLVEIFVPSEYTGGVMGEVTAKRGRPMGMESVGSGNDKISAEIPLAEMLDFSPQLSSLTSGKGYFTMKFLKYTEVPGDIQKKIISENTQEE
ncbi:MAG TPA: elongation factor G [Tepiditoga sp.]|nr:elongation factor G [Thermotogota bacterium]HOO74456.1 elongation factor G [Tepiditoga sp.]